VVTYWRCQPARGNDKCRVNDPDIHRLESWICDIGH
jgi:hypothetical protein